MENLRTNEWLVFEDDGGDAAEYAAFAEQVEMSPEDAAEHHEFVKRVGQEFGFPLSEWQPTIPTKSRD
jgi:hypothetical protein